MTIETSHSPHPLRVDQAANGYIVFAPREYGEAIVTAECHVFDSQAALFEYLAKHFTHTAAGEPFFVSGTGPHARVNTGGQDGKADAVGFTNFGRRE